MVEGVFFIIKMGLNIVANISTLFLPLSNLVRCLGAEVSVTVPDYCVRFHVI